MLRLVNTHFEEAWGEALGYEKKIWAQESATGEHGWHLRMDGGLGITHHDAAHLDAGLGWRPASVFICCEILGRLLTLSEPS